MTSAMELGEIYKQSDKMEEKGYVKRVRSSDDRRVIYVELTEKGKEFIEKMKKSTR